MVSITAYGGVNEIGGNKFLLEDKDARIYLDFGQSFDFGEDYFYEYLTPRPINGLEVYFEFGLMPRVKKLYGKDMLALSDLKHEKPDVDAVFISHSHSDHTNHLPFLDESIPVYMGHGTHRILEIYHKLYPSLSNIGEHTQLQLFKSGDKIKVKHLIIEPIHVEHSIPGAYGFVIHTSKGPLIYTGDFRMHGPQSGLTKEFVEKVAKVKPYALLIEGTRVGYETEHNNTEAEVGEKVDTIVKASKGIVFAYFSMSNVDRFLSFYNAAIKNGRKMIVDTKFAYLLDNMKDKIPALPDVMTDDNIMVYFRLSKTGTFIEKDYYVWERKYIPKMITYKEISKNQPKYVMHMGFYKLMELCYIKPKNADYIYSSSEHFLEGEDNRAEKTVLDNWMHHFKVKFHKDVHCSGHASKQDIEEVIKRVKPEILVPIHTADADVFDGFHSKVIKLQKEQKTEI